MPGPAISKALQPYSEVTFYQLARGCVLYPLHVHLSTGVAHPEIVLKIIGDKGLKPYFLTPDAHTRLETAWQALEQTLPELYNFIRSFYAKIKNHDYAPHDPAAWDAFFSDVSAGVSSRLDVITQQLRRLDIPDVSVPPDAGDSRLARWARWLEKMPAELEACLSEVASVLDPDVVESRAVRL